MDVVNQFGSRKKTGTKQADYERRSIPSCMDYELFLILTNLYLLDSTKDTKKD